MGKSIEALHQECEEYVGESQNAKSAHDIVEDIANLDTEIITDGLKDFVERAVYLNNLWRDDLTLQGYADESNILIEEFCGFLAEKFA